MVVIQRFKVLFLPVTPQSIIKNHREFDAVIMQVLNAWKKGSFLQVVGFQKLRILMAWMQNIQEGLTSHPF
ncbi:hypothetical protein [Mucilaginibacter jinjuensis]|uniref:Uncharacterized protein n=1 Tax=Mucilaginibacter jinjuensis TaxID=1176721 RepID=A0ABY7TAT3_9SPHI|nr:hypothetical protein [Mucilaginibacter jinjuensis]WCT13299.1 hypothetical protein PQO05_05055 [Mucilaginibacter jinjuensis]